MSRDKLNLKLNAGIHTLSIKIMGFYTLQIQGISQIKSYADSNGEIWSILKVNPSTFCNFELNNYNDILLVLNNLLNVLGVNEYQLTRVDFKLDTYEDTYEAMLKLNRLLISLLSVELGIDNRYHSVDFLTLDNLTLRIQNEYFEVENYNKAIESKHKDKAQNRLEFRSKALLKKKQDIPMLIQDWIRKLDRLPQIYDELQDLCNCYLIRKWDSEYYKVKNYSEFVRKYQDSIYSSKQLIKLFKLLGFSNPKNTAYTFKSRNEINYISKSDLVDYIKIIKGSLNKFLASCTVNKNTEIDKYPLDKAV